MSIKQHPNQLPTYRNHGTMWGAVADAGMQILNCADEIHDQILQKDACLEVPKIFSEEPAKAAIIAPTIITDEIAFVTDIKGVCKDGVTLHTT